MNMKKISLAAVTLFAAGGIAFATLDDKTQPTGKPEPKPREARPAALAIGATAPEFSLTDTDGKTVKLADFAGKTVVLEWFNPECPFVVKQYANTRVMADTKKAASEAGAVWLAINSGAPGKQGAGKELNAKMKAEWKIENPILLDESGETGKAYGARTTPHMFIIKDGKVVYMGAIDNNSGPKDAGDKNYVIMALSDIKAGKPVAEASTKPYGCSVKYGK